MSANFDSSQGVTFLFKNVYQAVKQAQNNQNAQSNIAEMAAPVGKVIKADSEAIQPYFPKEIEPKYGARKFAVPMGVMEAENKAANQRIQAMSQMKKNMADLTSAHERLRFLLQELNDLSKKDS